MYQRIKEIFHKINKIDKCQFSTDLEKVVSKSSNIEDLNELADFYNLHLARHLDKHAPIVEKIVTIRRSVPWFDDHANNLKRKVCKAEKKVRENKTETNSLIFHGLLKEYKKHLRVVKFIHLHGVIQEAGNNNKKLFNVVLDMTRIL